MTVAELIETLKKVPDQTSHVYIGCEKERSADVARTILESGLVVIEQVSAVLDDSPFVVICGIGERDMEKLVQQALTEAVTNVH